MTKSPMTILLAMDMQLSDHNCYVGLYSSNQSIPKPLDITPRSLIAMHPLCPRIKGIIMLQSQ